MNVRDIDGKTPLIVAYQYGRLSIDYLRVGQGQISKKIFLLSSICSQKNVGNRAPKVDDEAVFKGRTSNIKGLLFWCSSTLLSKVDKLEAASMYNAPLLSYFFFTRAAPSLKGTLGGDVRSFLAGFRPPTSRHKSCCVIAPICEQGPPY